MPFFTCIRKHSFLSLAKLIKLFWNLFIVHYLFIYFSLDERQPCVQENSWVLGTEILN